ncbi:hypothetical protein [Streptomyces sp. SAS_260]|uniref:hypothetical protein n=1 Tax=Streptomyces sp. SAS_260 TaxID=3412751 RepID=UPI00403D34BB
MGATIVIAGSPAAADGGGYWAKQCDYGRACLYLSGLRSGPGGPIWNIDGCGWHAVNDHYDAGLTHGNSMTVYYRDNRWDIVDAWTGRSLDPANVVTTVFVSC